MAMIMANFFDYSKILQALHFYLSRHVHFRKLY